MPNNLIPPVERTFQSTMNPNNGKRFSKQGSYNVPKQGIVLQGTAQQANVQPPNTSNKQFNLLDGINTQQFMEIRDGLAKLNGKIAKPLGGVENFKRK